MAETASMYKKKLTATLRAGFTPACINDTEIPPPNVVYSLVAIQSLQTKIWLEKTLNPLFLAQHSENLEFLVTKI